ncbi:MAG TPA: hypothetical protein VGV35_14785, partial [Bryobacteraceae bacterium]|nr:hypothetical protein [Bryobacteraceae bacterium]
MVNRIPIVLALAVTIAAADESAVVLKTASSHSMQFYLSLPHGWTAEKSWPVVMVIESANRQFQATAELFAKARGDRPFILATPLVTTNGGASYRLAPAYHYSDAVWNEMERVGRCTFDLDGIAAIASDL